MDRSKKKIKSDNNLRFHLFLAETLNKSISEIMKMPVQEFDMWVAYFDIKNEEEQKALNKQKMSLKHR